MSGCGWFGVGIFDYFSMVGSTLFRLELFCKVLFFLISNGDRLLSPLGTKFLASDTHLCKAWSDFVLLFVFLYDVITGTDACKPSWETIVRFRVGPSLFWDFLSFFSVVADPWGSPLILLPFLMTLSGVPEPFIYSASQFVL